ncbi:MAG: hypothetical protein IPK26_28180 [Planctomycetes bacterium]|nr:hypothetical protein [Planctomycetota bacterium]
MPDSNRCSSFLLLALALPAQSPPPIDWRQHAEQHLVAARDRTLATCKDRGLQLPDEFLAWVDAEATRRASVWGCRRDPLPVLLLLRSLEIDLGERTVRSDYPQLAIAFAIAGSYRPLGGKAGGWNDGDDAVEMALPDIRPRPPLQLVIPTDPRVRVDCKDKNRALDRDDHIVNFLEDHAEIEVDAPKEPLPPLVYDERGIAAPHRPTAAGKLRRPLVAADVIASAALQREFNDYMTAHGHRDVRIDCGDRAVHWFSTEAIDDRAHRERIKAAHELLHTAYRNKGRMPAERDRAPTAAESMAWFIRNDRQPFTDAERQERKVARFPLQAPWPVLLMLAADDQPLREREAIWTAVQGGAPLRTYGEYIGGIAQQFDMQSARRVSPFPFAYGSIQMMWKDGGVCGTMGNIGARSHRIAGSPASTAGQPGHCAVVRMTHDATTGKFHCRGEQYASGGDDVTTVHAGFDYDDVGGRRPMAWHQSVAAGVSHDPATFVTTLVMRRAFDALEPAARAAQAVALVEQGLQVNPFAIVLVDAAVTAAPDHRLALAIADACATQLAKTVPGQEHELYRTTIRDLAHARIEQLPPASPEAWSSLLDELERQGCTRPSLLARCWQGSEGEQGFATRSKAAIGEYLASPERSKNRRAGNALARTVETWAKSLKGKARKESWAATLLEPFAGKEILTLRGKQVVDPVVVVLCKLAGRPQPVIGDGK